MLVLQLFTRMVTIQTYKNSNKKLVHFCEDEGSGDHCEMLTRSLYNQRVFDWLDQAL